MGLQLLDFKEKINLARYNTMAVQAKAELMVCLQDISALPAISDFCMANPTLPWKVFGSASNILITEDIAGLVIINQLKGIQLVKQDSEYVWLQVASGENWHDLVEYTVAKGWGGIENLALIPGTVGAAPVQNIGAYGVELADVFELLTAFDLSSGVSRSFQKADCEFSYRHSIFKTYDCCPYLITSIVIKLRKKPLYTLKYQSLLSALENKDAPYTLTEIMQTVIDIRQGKLPNPNVLPNTGSFFKNPWLDQNQLSYVQSVYPDIKILQTQKKQLEKYFKISAASLIEYCGWKGCQKYGCGVYDKHALVIVNYSQSNGQYIRCLANEIMQSVDNAFHILLEPEVIIL